MKNKLPQLLLSLIITNLLLPPILTSADYNQSIAQTYLQNNQGSSPWVTMALASLGATNLNSDYLKSINSATAIQYEAPILAVTSLGDDPRTFSSTDYVAKLKSFFSGGQLGDPTTLNDDIFGILALVSAGVPASDQVVLGSKNFLFAKQNTDGGWGFATPGSSSADMTAAAMVALISSGTSATDSHIQNAITYIKTAQNSDGGFTYDPQSKYGTDSDGSTTSWVLWAINSLGSPLSDWTKSGHTPVDYLNSIQDPGGFFAFQPGAAANSLSPDLTGQAVIALTGKTLPLKIASQTQSATVNFRIEGSAANICSGQVAAVTAMDVVKNASAQCGYTYNIESTSYGPYLNQINSDTASGDTGWLFLDNNTPLQIGAADFQVQPNDNLLVYYGGTGWLPAKLDLSAKAAESGQSVTATVQDFTGGAWAALANATVDFGALTATTDQNGRAQITAPDGYYKIYAQKAGYVRSNSILLKIGQPSASNVSLSANFSGGQVAGTSTPPSGSTLSFTVDANSLNFGDITPGGQVSKALHVQNNSDAAINISASVSGDPLFSNNLSLNGKFWQNFSSPIDSGQNQAITAGLNIPNNFTGASGAKIGQLVLWASAQ